MKLIELGCKKFQVLAICDEKGNCHILDYLMSLGRSHIPSTRMLSRLRQVIPENGPEYHNRDKVKHLKDGIFEFRLTPKSGPKPRVFFFVDDVNIIVCTEAFNKRGDKLDSFIGKAIEYRELYLVAKMNLKLDIEKLEE